jgi:tetratricopeptide (TPR) repeat protein/predicted acylesterase/phospholipase RssA
MWIRIWPAAVAGAIDVFTWSWPALAGVISLAYLFATACTLLRSLPLLHRWLNLQLILAACLSLLAGLIFGFIGRDMGLSTLFWHEIYQTQFLAGLGIGALTVLLGLFTFLRDDNRPFLHALAEWELRKPIAGLGWPRERGFIPPPAPQAPARQLIGLLNAMTLPFLVALFTRPFLTTLSTEIGDEHGFRDWLLPLGVLVVLVITDLCLVVADILLRGRTISSHVVKWLVVVLPALVFSLTLVGSVRDLIPAALSICLFLALIAWVAYVTYGKVLLRVVLLLMVLGAMCVTDGSPYKLTYPGLEAYYAKGRLVKPWLSAQALPAVAKAKADGAPAPLAKTMGHRTRAEEIRERAGEILERLKQKAETLARLPPDDFTTQMGLGLNAFQRAVFLEKTPISAEEISSYRKRAEAAAEAIRLRPDDRRAYAALAALLEDIPLPANSFEKAERAFAKAIRLRPDAAEAYTNLATTRLKLFPTPPGPTDAEAAKTREDTIHRLYRQAILLAPDDPPHRRGLGIALAIDRRYADALEQLKEAIRLDPGDVYALAARGFVHFNQGKPGSSATALRDLDEAGKLDPESALVYGYKGYIQLRSNDNVAALASLSRAVELDPGSAAFRAQRGVAYYNNREYEKAIEDFEEAAKSPRHRAEVQFNMGLAYFVWDDPMGRKDQGRLAKAVEAFDRAAATEPGVSAKVLLMMRGYARTLLGDALGRASDRAPTLFREAVCDLVAAGRLRPEAEEGSIVNIRLAARCSLLSLQPEQDAKCATDEALPAILADLKAAAQLDPGDRETKRRKYVAYFEGKNQAARDAIASLKFDDPPAAKSKPMGAPGGASGGDTDQRDAAISQEAISFPLPFIIPDLHPGQFSDREILWQWKWAREDEAKRPRKGDAKCAKVGASGDFKPKLVIVAVSGGGIAAAYWTALCLTRIEEQFADFPRHVRIVTGASGGMLGAAYYISTLRAKDDFRSPDDLAKIRDNLARDGLTKLVSQLVMGDIPSTFDPRDLDVDRGRILEELWEKNTQSGAGGGLATQFRDLARGEQEGWRPSLLVSPTIVEGGKRLLISNLDLDGLSGGYEFFKLFPDARIKLSTAVRMSAAFPYALPTVNLPTDPPLRVVDAGYLDNYGVDLATEWIERNRDWLGEKLSGVILVQIRAYRLDPAFRERERDDDPSPEASRLLGGPLPELAQSLGRELQWLTTPFESVLSVNRGTMVAGNDVRVRQLERSFNDRRDIPVFWSFIFECDESAPMSLYLTGSDRKRLDRAFEAARIQKRLGQLVDILRDAPPLSPRPDSGAGRP